LQPVPLVNINYIQQDFLPITGQVLSLGKKYIFILTSFSFLATLPRESFRVGKKQPSN